MLAEGEPDLVVAFPGGRGIANMVKQARAAGVEVLEASAGGGWGRFEGPCYCRFHSAAFNTVSTCIASNGKMIAPFVRLAQDACISDCMDVAVNGVHVRAP
jgi:hypothetical protein